MRTLVVAWLSVVCLAPSLAAEQRYGSGYEPKPPEPFPPAYKDYQILLDTISPDQRYAFIYPKRSRLYELHDYALFLAALKPFRIISRVPTGHSNLAENARNYYAADWTKDASTTVFIAGSKWGPEKVWVLQLRGGKIAKKADLATAVRQQVLPDYKKSRARRYNGYYDFVFEDDLEDISGWKPDDSGHVVIETTCTNDPKEIVQRRWAVRFKGTWDVARGRFIEKSLTRIPPRPGQTMERTRKAFGVAEL